MAWHTLSTTRPRSARVRENFDNFGLQIAQQLATLGSIGLPGSESTLAGWVSTGAAPRFTGLHDIPLAQSHLSSPASNLNFPFPGPVGAEAFTNIVDDGLKTPHSSQIDLSVQRDLPGGWTLETDYVGRFGRRTLQNIDFGMPLDLVDPASGSDYFAAVDQSENQHYAGVATTSVDKIPYWENLFPDAAGVGPTNNGRAGLTATQNIYNHFATNPLNASYGIYSMDVLCNPGCGGSYNRFYASQFSSMQTQASIGTTSYNSGQLILRHPMKRGLSADFSYTYGKSFDLGSDAERSGGGSYNPGAFTGYTTFSQILDAFHPGKNRAVSDFDAAPRHGGLELQSALRARQAVSADREQAGARPDRGLAVDGPRSLDQRTSVRSAGRRGMGDGMVLPELPGEDGQCSHEKAHHPGRGA